MASVEVVSNYSCSLGEGPHWDNRSNKLYHVDIINHDIYTIDVITKEYEKIHLPELITIVIPTTNSDELLVTQGKKICLINRISKEPFKVFATENNSKTTFNDGKCDSKGRLWIGTMGILNKYTLIEPNLGSLYCLDNKGTLKCKQDKVSISNGICWSNDDKNMYYVDSWDRKIFLFDFNKEIGEIDNRKVFFDFNKHSLFGENEFPDGLCIDSNDKVWCACYNGNKIIRIDQERGEVIANIEFSTSKITSLCFGGKNMNEIFVTSAFDGLTEEQRSLEKDSGKLFSVKLLKENIKGPYANVFAN